MFDSVDTVSDCIKIATGVLSTVRINPSRMKAGLSADMLATDLAEYLVRKGMAVSQPPPAKLASRTWRPNSSYYPSRAVCIRLLDASVSARIVESIH